MEHKYHQVVDWKYLDHPSMCSVWENMLMTNIIVTFINMLCLQKEK